MSSFYKQPGFLLGILIFLCALGLRLAFVYEYGNEINIQYYLFDQTDNNTFHRWAQNIAHGDVLCKNQIHPHHIWTDKVASEEQWNQWYGDVKIYHQAPLYPYVIAMIYALFGEDPLYVRIFQALISALTVLFVFLMGRHYFSTSVGLAAGLLLMLCGFHFFYNIFLLREGLIAFLSITFLYVFTLAYERGSAPLFGVSGLLLGLNIITKPNALLWAPLLMLGMLMFKRTRPFRSNGRLILVFVAFILIPITPLIIRNIALGCPALQISTRGPTAFINGNLRGQSGNQWNPPIEETRRILTESDYKLSPVIRQTLKSYEDKPSEYLLQIWKKTTAFFNSYEAPNNTNFYLIRGLSQALKMGFISYWFLAPAAILGIILALTQAKRIWPLYLITFTMMLSAIAFFIVARFRQPVVPMFAIFAGYVLVWMIKNIRNKKAIPLLLTSGAFTGLLLYTDHDELTYSTNSSAISGAMLALAAQEEFGAANRFRRLLHQQLHNPDYFEPDQETRLESLRTGFIEFAKSGFHSEDKARHFLLKARGYFDLSKTTRSEQLKEFAALVETHVNKALALDPQIKGAHFILAKTYVEWMNQEESEQVKLSLFQKAHEHFLLEEKNNPDDPETLKALGACFIFAGNHAKTVAYYKKYLLKAPDWDHEIASRLAWIYVSRLKDPSKLNAALFFSQDAYLSDPENLRFCEHYAYILGATGRMDQAIKILKKMMQLDPKSADLYKKRINNFLKNKKE